MDSNANWILDVVTIMLLYLFLKQLVILLSLFIIFLNYVKDLFI
jgi:hypothetical protein